MIELLEKIKQLYAKYGVPDIDPAIVCICIDAREDEDRLQNLSDHFGVYLGDFYNSLLDKNRGEEDESDKLYDALFVHPKEYDEESEFRVATPLILSDAGKLIWGHSCYFMKYEELLERHKVPIPEITAKFYENNALEKLEQILQMEHSYRIPGKNAANE